MSLFTLPWLRRWQKAVLVLAVAIGLIPIDAHAGDPQLKWYTLTTDNFRIHYHGGLESHAQRLAQLAEQLEKRLVSWLGHPPAERTEIVLTDSSDSSNGMASVLPYSAITLFVTAPDDSSVLNDYDDWLPTLASHEQTHIVHLNNVSGLPRLLSSILGKQTAPNQLQPHWLIEGLAVYAETRLSSGGRLRSSVFDMYMRADALEDNFAELDQITHVPRRWPGATLWYLYGAKFVEFVVSVYGEKVFAQVAADAGDEVIPFGINRQIYRATGRTYSDLFVAFKGAQRRRYAAQAAAIDARGRREGRRLTFHGYGANSPRFVPERCWNAFGFEQPTLLYFRDDGHDATGFATIPLTGDSGRAGGTLITRSNGGSASFTSDCDVLMQSNAPSQRLYSFNDLFLQRHGTRSPRGWEQGRSRLTMGRRARDPDVSHNGHEVVYVTDSAGTTTLRISDFTHGQLTNERALVPGVRNEQVFTPRFSPNDRYVAYGVWTRGGYRDLRVLDRATGSIRTLWKDRAVDQEPSWSPDGRVLYFSSDRTGVSNVYAFDLETNRLRQVTNVLTGAFMPEVSPDGRTLVYVGYGSGGYDLYALSLDESSLLLPLPSTNDRDDRVFLEDRGWLQPTAYNPLLTLSPRALLLDYRSDSANQQFIASVRGSDIVGLHSVGASAVVNSGNSQPDLFASYAYSGYKETLVAGLSRTTDPNTQFSYGSGTRTIRRVRTSASTGVHIPLPGEFSSQALSLSYVAAHIDAELPTGVGADPYALVPAEPFRGFTSSLRFGYQFSNIEQYLYSVSAERGVSVNVSVDYASRYFGSQLEGSSAFARFFSYTPIPVAKHHVLALGATLAASAGPAEGGYALGGYQDSPLLTSILDGIVQSRLTLRGYPTAKYQGSHLVLLQSEYRFPAIWIDRGLSTLPFFLRGFSAALGADYGGAFNDFAGKNLSSRLRLGLAGELWTYVTFGYGLDVQLALGYARGTGEGAISGGTTYMVVNSGL